MAAQSRSADKGAPMLRRLVLAFMFILAAIGAFAHSGPQGSLSPSGGGGGFAHKLRVTADATFENDAETFGTRPDRKPISVKIQAVRLGPGSQP